MTIQRKYLSTGKAGEYNKPKRKEVEVFWAKSKPYLLTTKDKGKNKEKREKEPNVI